MTSWATPETNNKITLICRQTRYSGKFKSATTSSEAAKNLSALTKPLLVSSEYCKLQQLHPSLRLSLASLRTKSYSCALYTEIDLQTCFNCPVSVLGCTIDKVRPVVSLNNSKSWCLPHFNYFDLHRTAVFSSIVPYKNEARRAQLSQTNFSGQIRRQLHYRPDSAERAKAELQFSRRKLFNRAQI